MDMTRPVFIEGRITHFQCSVCERFLYEEPMIYGDEWVNAPEELVCRECHPSLIGLTKEEFFEACGV